jgi:uncharacterized protein (DUF2237 family)
VGAKTEIGTETVNKRKVIHMAANVHGQPLQGCSDDPLTGYYRDGFCHTGETDSGTHVVCAEMTEEFLAFTAGRGNDLSTARPQWMFPGLKPGDRWCLCALRWDEARQAGTAPPVVTEATHIGVLEYIDEAVLNAYAVK